MCSYYKAYIWYVSGPLFQIWNLYLYLCKIKHMFTVIN